MTIYQPINDQLKSQIQMLFDRINATHPHDQQGNSRSQEDLILAWADVVSLFPDRHAPHDDFDWDRFFKLRREFIAATADSDIARVVTTLLAFKDFYLEVIAKCLKA